MLPMEAETFVNQQHSPNTTAAYTFDLRKWFAFLGGRKPTRQIALDFRKHLEERVKPRSAARTFNTCRAYYKWLGGENVFLSIKSPRRLTEAIPNVPTDAEVDAIVSVAESANDRALVALLLNGLRISEASALKPEDFIYSKEYDAWLINVIGKGFRQRLVPASDESVVAVQRVLASSPRGYLLGDGSRLTNRQMQYRIEKLSERAGIQRLHPHQLRHHYATRLLREGVDLETIRRLLGHQTIATTSMYIGLNLGDVVKASRKDPRNDTIR